MACLPFAPTLAHDPGDADASALAWMLYLGALPTAVAFTTWAYALARSTAGRMGALTYLVPPLTILLGWAILGETPPALAVLGGALCLFGAAWRGAAEHDAVYDPGCAELPLSGGCLCGAVRYEVTEQPRAGALLPLHALSAEDRRRCVRAGAHRRLDAAGGPGERPCAATAARRLREAVLPECGSQLFSRNPANPPT